MSSHPHPLDGARFKVVRAQEHLDALKTEIRSYLDEKPYRITLERDGNRNFWWAKPVLEKSPPPRLSGLCGDCVNNAREALDYIAWQVAKRHMTSFNPVDDKRWINFPIYSNALDQGYINKINRFTNRGMPAGAVSLIQAVQPCNAGYEAMGWLHQLVNPNKHQDPLFTVSIGAGTTVWCEVYDELGGLLSTGPEVETDFAGGAVGVGVGRMQLTTKHTVEVHGQVSSFVSFQDVSMPRGSVDFVLDNVVKCVASIIPRFDKFF